MYRRTFVAALGAALVPNDAAQAPSRAAASLGDALERAKSLNQQIQAALDNAMRVLQYAEYAQTYVIAAELNVAPPKPPKMQQHIASLADAIDEWTRRIDAIEAPTFDVLPQLPAISAGADPDTQRNLVRQAYAAFISSVNVLDQQRARTSMFQVLTRRCDLAGKLFEDGFEGNMKLYATAGALEGGEIFELAAIHYATDLPPRLRLASEAISAAKTRTATAIDQEANSLAAYGASLLNTLSSEQLVLKAENDRLAKMENDIKQQRARFDEHQSLLQQEANNLQALQESINGKKDAIEKTKQSLAGLQNQLSGMPQKIADLWNAWHQDYNLCPYHQDWWHCCVNACDHAYLKTDFEQRDRPSKRRYVEATKEKADLDVQTSNLRLSIRDQENQVAAAQTELADRNKKLMNAQADLNSKQRDLDRRVLQALGDEWHSRGRTRYAEVQAEFATVSGAVKRL